MLEKKGDDHDDWLAFQESTSAADFADSSFGTVIQVSYWHAAYRPEI